jgi:lipid-binding SYLF domain-containing protein
MEGRDMRKQLVHSFIKVFAVCILLVGYPATSVLAATAAEINAEVATAMTQFRKDVKGANEYLKVAKAVLVIPNVKKVGFVLAAQWGTGALQVGGRTAAYYTMEAGSAGFQAGYQSADYVFIFFTEEAVKKFRQGEGWTVGAEAGLTFVEGIAGASADTLKGQGDVAGFAFAQEGVMAGWSAKGTKFSHVVPDK